MTHDDFRDSQILKNNTKWPKCFFWPTRKNIYRPEKTLGLREAWRLFWPGPVGYYKGFQVKAGCEGQLARFRKMIGKWLGGFLVAGHKTLATGRDFRDPRIKSILRNRASVFLWPATKKRFIYCPERREFGDRKYWM